MTTNDPYSAERVRAWAALQYPSGTPLDQDRRMVAAETEAYLSGRTGRETSELSQAAKHAGPVDPPAAQEPTDAECIAVLNAVTTPFGEKPRKTEWAPAAIQRCREAMVSARAARRGKEER